MRSTIRLGGLALLCLVACDDPRWERQEDGTVVPDDLPSYNPEQAGQAELPDVRRTDRIATIDPDGLEAKVYFDPGAEDPKEVDALTAVLQPTAGSDVRGTVTFTKADNGVRVETRVTGLTAGTHAYHVHAYGDCSGTDGKTAGPHFDFLAGDREGKPHEITGNLGELSVGEDGTATHSATIPDAELTGRQGILGRSVVIHEKGNDPSQPPDGAAGNRLSCGVIGMGNPENEVAAADPM